MNKDSYLILDTLPPEYDSRVKAMEVDEKPTEDYSDIGGLDKQIQVGKQFPSIAMELLLRSNMILIIIGHGWNELHFNTL